MNFNPALALKVVRICGKLQIRQFLLCLLVFAVATALLCISVPSISSNPWFQDINILIAYKSGDFGIVFRNWNLFLRGMLELTGFYLGFFCLFFIAVLVNRSFDYMSAKYHLFIAFDRNDKCFIDGNANSSLFEIRFAAGESLMVLKVRDGNDFDCFELSSLAETPDTVNQAIEQAVVSHPENTRVRALTARIYEPI